MLPEAIKIKAKEWNLEISTVWGLPREAFDMEQSHNAKLFGVQIVQLCVTDSEHRTQEFNVCLGDFQSSFGLIIPSVPSLFIWSENVYHVPWCLETM